MGEGSVDLSPVEAERESLFLFNAPLIASNSTVSRVGSLTADWERFFEVLPHGVQTYRARGRAAPGVAGGDAARDVRSCCYEGSKATNRLSTV